jgi:hypothetical protein
MRSTVAAPVAGIGPGLADAAGGALAVLRA